MQLVSESDLPVDIQTYLDRRKCGSCGNPLGSIALAEIVRLSWSPKFRCLPPIPSCWQITCPGCGREIVFCLRKGKAWPLVPGSVSRRSPKRRDG
jgi:hypothetical protein